MRQLKVFLASLCLTIIALGTSAPAAIAQSDNFSQRILPIDCVFQVVDTGTQQLIYLTPAKCGQILPPAPPLPPVPPLPPQEPNAPPSKPSLTNPSPPLYGLTPQHFTLFHTFSAPPSTKTGQKPNKTITINSNKSFHTNGVTLHKIKPGQIISFTVGHRGNSHRHSLAISSIHEDYVIISFNSGPKNSKLHAGQEKQYNITGDSQKDVAVKVEKIKNHQVDLWMRQLHDAPTNYKKPLQRKGMAMAIIAIIIVLIILVLTLGSWLGSAKLARPRKRR